MEVQDFIDIYHDQLSSRESLMLLLDKYKYHPDLTQKLDEIGGVDFDREKIYEIVLWKISRFPYISDETINSVNELKNIAFNGLEASKPAIEKLLLTKGIKLPMASAILRFRNPNVFQIIDERAYEIVFPGEAIYPNKPYYKITKSYIDTSISIYFKYLRFVKSLADQL